MVISLSEKKKTTNNNKKTALVSLIAFRKYRESSVLYVLTDTLFSTFVRLDALHVNHTNAEDLSYDSFLDADMECTNMYYI